VLRACRILGAVVLAAFALTTLTPLATRIAARYAAQPRLAPADAIVVLGGGLVNEALGDPSLQRVIEGVTLFRRGLAPLILFTGEPAATGRSEPEIRAGIARALGVPSGAILTATANTTHEEAQAAAALLRPRGIRAVLLVSASMHLVRARGAFEREGFEVLPAPADQVLTVGSGAGERLVVARTLVRELVGWWYYRMAGYL
jgi:uncharacterized SAM-binding protein YcdF (DUF218 family)